MLLLHVRRKSLSGTCEMSDCKLVFVNNGGCEILKSISKGCLCIVGRKGGLWMSKTGVEHVTNLEHYEN